MHFCMSSMSSSSRYASVRHASASACLRDEDLASMRTLCTSDPPHSCQLPLLGIKRQSDVYSCIKHVHANGVERVFMAVHLARKYHSYIGYTARAKYIFWAGIYFSATWHEVASASHPFPDFDISLRQRHRHRICALAQGSAHNWCNQRACSC